MSLGSSSGSAGIAAIIGGCLATAWVVTLVTGEYAHWPFVLAGILVGLWAAQSISN